MTIRWQHILIIALLAGCVIAASIIVWRQRSLQEPPVLSTAQEITALQLQEHALPESCWVASGVKVYNATAFLVRNPDSDIQKFCGKQLDNPSSKTLESLKSYYIGLLVP